jgi:nucleoside-diphosphate-sugar epimerase
MKVFVAGATGALGKQLVPMLVEAGHEVTGMSRSPVKRGEIEALGAKAAFADALNAEAVAAAVGEADPDVIVHELTAISGDMDFKHFDKGFEPTNRLRTEATDHLLSAGRAVGVKKFVAQSFAPWPYARVGGPVKSESDPLDSDPPEQVRKTIEAIRYLEDAVTGAEWTDGIALRYGGFYGPGTSFSSDGEMADVIRARKFPIVGDGGGVWSFIHITDAAEATLAAVERGRRGIYNVVDDEPATAAEWLPVVAENVGAKPPRRVPKFIGRLFGGEVAVVMMTELRGSSNAKAKRELGWRPGHPTWRTELGKA